LFQSFLHDFFGRDSPAFRFTLQALGERVRKLDGKRAH